MPLAGLYDHISRVSLIKEYWKKFEIQSIRYSLIIQISLIIQTPNLD